ncbi:MAG TPA: CotH kinase family protein [Candidatus Limnocylindria bacterium]|nr:CotH kinase family protein [Candidatus Limnocylindria bacterium]
MRTGQTSLAVLVIALTSLVSTGAFAANYSPGQSTPAASANKDKKQKRAPAEEIFDNKTVLSFRIEISPRELVFLRHEDDRKDVRATIYEGTNVWHDVGLHVKGAAGSRRGIDDKPALTLNFGKFTPKQRFHGLRKIHLNNSVQDGSYLTENLCSELYRKAGVPTPRVSYATLELNGKKRGLYVLKEGFTKDMLEIYFKNPEGNLYDGGFLREITDQLERDLDGDEDVRDWSDLKALTKAAQHTDPLTRFDELSKVLDMDRFLSFAALQVMTWDWDGYVMNRNNYRVYHDLGTGKMVFLPHGMDQMFWEVNHFIIPRPKRFNGLVARAMIETPQGKKFYRERFGQVFTNVFQIEMLTNRVDELAALLRPYAGNTNEYNGQVKRIRDLIVAQHANFEKRLREPEPQPTVFASGIAKIRNWAIPSPEPRDPAKALRDQVDVDGRHALHIITTNHTTNTTASWRATVYLGEGKYRFETMAKGAGIVPALDIKKGEGAGIRQHGTQTNRLNKLIGDAPWQKLEYEFPIQFEQEVTLICELRATAGEVWFDADSMRLVKTE